MNLKIHTFHYQWAVSLVDSEQLSQSEFIIHYLQKPVIDGIISVPVIDGIFQFPTNFKHETKQCLFESQCLYCNVKHGICRIYTCKNITSKM